MPQLLNNMWLMAIMSNMPWQFKRVKSKDAVHVLSDGEQSCWTGVKAAHITFFSNIIMSTHDLERNNSGCNHSKAPLFTCRDQISEVTASNCKCENDQSQDIVMPLVSNSLSCLPIHPQNARSSGFHALNIVGFLKTCKTCNTLKHGGWGKRWINLETSLIITWTLEENVGVVDFAPPLERRGARNFVCAAVFLHIFLWMNICRGTLSRHQHPGPSKFFFGLSCVNLSSMKLKNTFNGLPKQNEKQNAMPRLASVYVPHPPSKIPVDVLSWTCQSQETWLSK